MALEHWHGTSFDWLAWHGGSLTRFGVQHDTRHIVAMRHLVVRYAVAWCEGDRVLCRPKRGTIAVMFLQGGELWWTHLTEEEFDACFPCVLRRHRGEGS